MDPLPLSLLNDHLYCPRRAALKAIEGLRGENKFTVEGSLAHEHVDLPGFEQRAGWTLLRGLPIYSDRIGLSGKADLVEARRDGSAIHEARPVEYKRGRKSKWSNDHVQLCAQALCLEEMFGIPISEGLVFHISSQKRTTVAFTPELRAATERAAGELRTMLDSGRVPPATLKPQCDGCSLFDVCLPQITRDSKNTVVKSLFDI